MLKPDWRVVAFGLIVSALASAGKASETRLSVGDETFAFDKLYLAPQREDGVVELQTFYPGFAPAGGSSDLNEKTDVSARFERTVFLELQPADKQLDPADRTTRLYLRFLGDATDSGASGLVKRSFAPGSPFEGDDLFFAPPEGHKFAARCRSRGALPEVCYASFRFGRVDATLRFAAKWLPEWEMLLKGAQDLLARARN